MFSQVHKYYLTNRVSIMMLSKDSFWTFFSQIVVTIVNFLSVLVLANLFTQNDYGTFKLITTWLAIATGIGYTGYVYTLPQKVATRENYDLKSIYKKTLINSSLAFFGLFAISIYYFYFQNLNLSVGFLFASILGPILCISQLVNIYYMGRKEFKKFALVQNFVDFVQLITIFTLAYFQFSFVLILVMYFTITIITNVAIILYSLLDDRKYKEKIKELPITNITQDISEENKKRKKLNISGIIFNLTYQVDKLLIFHFIGAVPLAIYSIVTAISDQARTPFKAFTAALFPRMTSINFNLKKLYFTYFILTILSIFLFLILIFAYPFIFTYFFPKYSEYVYLANLATIGVLFAPNQLLYLYAQSKNKLDIINNFANLTSILQIFFYSFAIFLGSIFYVILFKNIINLIMTIFLFVKIRN